MAAHVGSARAQERGPAAELCATGCSFLSQKQSITCSGEMHRFSDVMRKADFLKFKCCLNGFNTFNKFLKMIRFGGLHLGFVLILGWPDSPSSSVTVNGSR